MSKLLDKYNRRGVRTSYVSTIIGISLVLFMIGLVLGGVIGLDDVQRQAKETLQGDLFFKPEYSEADIKQVEQKLKTWQEFKEVTFVSPERAIEEFSGNDQTSQEILEIFEGENPLPPTISFQPKAQYATADGMTLLVLKIKDAFPDELEDVSYDEDAVKSVNLGFKQFVYLFLVVALLLIVVAVAMINNTIRLALYSKRFTIKTMQLVGATPRFIRRPFLWQSIFQGVVSAVLGMALVMALFYALNNYMSNFEISIQPLSFAALFGSLLIMGVIITFVSTFFALNKFLRMKLDELY
ncbi:MAG: permease-like cell division protein FtsX [Bacteroidetes bacterium]|nr:permease-like cell division protein FtsX [Bacteroidota bacterium]